MITERRQPAGDRHRFVSLPGGPGRDGAARGALAVSTVLAISVVFGVTAVQIGAVVLLGFAVMVAAVILAARAPRAVLLTTLLALPFTGVLRRATGSYAARVDPVVVAGPVLAILCVLILSRKDSIPRSPLTSAVTAMTGLGLVQILNPSQGGLTAGVLGAGLFVGPLVWFYVGRRIGDEATLEFVVRAMRIIIVVTAVYGVKQLLFGFTGFEHTWIAARRTTYAALDISGNIRPFSTFASGAEYSYFLALGAVLFAVGAGPMGRVLRSVAVIALVVACFFAGSRTVFVASVLAVVIIVLVQRIRSLGKALALCLAIGVVGLLLLRLVPLSADETTAGAVRNRTLVGLARPFDRESSTLGIHLDAVGRGLVEGLRTPLGRGAAVVNIVGERLGSQTISAEHDVPNTLIAYGWAGGVILAFLIVRVYRLLRACVLKRRRNLIGPGVFVLATFGVWFSGGLYAASALLWFFLGAIDRLNGEAEVIELGIGQGLGVRATAHPS